MSFHARLGVGMNFLIGLAVFAGLFYFIWRHRHPPTKLASDEAAQFHLGGDGTYDFDVAGEASYQDALDTIVGGKTEGGHEYECLALLIREPNNRHDKNAVAVSIDSRKVGYVPRREAASMAKLMDRKNIRNFTADALVVGGWSRGKRGEGHYGVKLDLQG